MKSYLHIVLFLFCIKSIDNATFRCDYQYSNFTNGWFKYHEIPTTWHEARLICALEGATLASPTSSKMLINILHRIKHMLPKDQQIFTGFHSTFAGGEYYTVDGTPLSEFNHEWVEGQPDNIQNDESCIILNSDGKLLDTNCGNTHPYMCFKSNEPETVTNECGTIDPEYKLDARTKQCYKFHVVPRNFSRAYLACSAEGGYLTIINSEVESQVLRDLFAKYQPTTMLGTFRKDLALIGFHDWGEHNDWRTVHGQTLAEAGYNKFSPGRPNSAVQYCGSIFRTGLLNDVLCNQPYPFICEKSPRFPKVCSNIDMDYLTEELYPLIYQWKSQKYTSKTGQ